MKNRYLVLASFLGLIIIAYQGGNFNAMAQTPSSDYTVAQAISLVESGKAPTFEVPVVGYIVNIESVETDYGYATYTIAETPEGDNTFQIYRGYSLNRQAFTDASQLTVGAKVKVQGGLTSYTDPYRFLMGSKVVEFIDEAAIATINSDTSAPEYFTLDGFKVTHPQKGIYIVLKDGKAIKVIL